MNATEWEIARPYEQVLAERVEAAHALYEAEIALHDAHQTHIDEWIEAASDRLHSAVVRHMAAQTLAKQLERTIAA
jgi:hypothetical protein